MLSFEQAAFVLNEAVHALPSDIFKDLNGGVNLLDKTLYDEDGCLVLGLYHCGNMGRYIEIFYGSILRGFPGCDDDGLRVQLIRTLHHELTHHIENKAGDRTLEHWDESQKQLRRKKRGSAS